MDSAGDILKRQPGVTSDAPYDYVVVLQRSAPRVARRGAWRRAGAASIAVLGVAVLFAISSQVLRPPGAAISRVQPAMLAAETDEPALVDLSQLNLRSELEDRIAWLDLQLSTGRAYSAPAAELAEMEDTRAQLARSLQQVSYAHSLMSL